MAERPCGLLTIQQNSCVSVNCSGPHLAARTARKSEGYRSTACYLSRWRPPESAMLNNELVVKVDLHKDKANNA